MLEYNEFDVHLGPESTHRWPGANIVGKVTVCRSVGRRSTVITCDADLTDLNKTLVSKVESGMISGICCQRALKVGRFKLLEGDALSKNAGPESRNSKYSTDIFARQLDEIIDTTNRTT